MQRVADVPDHLEADKTCQCEHDEMLHEACRRVGPDRQHEQPADRQHADLTLALSAVRGHLERQLFLWRQFGRFPGRRRLANGPDLRRRRREGHLAGIDRRRAADHVIFHIDHNLAVLFGCQVVKHMAYVGGVEARALRRHPAREICIADDRHAVIRFDDLVGDGEVAIATLFGGKIDDNRPRLHQADHLGGPQFRRRAPGDQGGGDDDVDLRRLGADRSISFSMNSGDAGLA